MVFPFTILYCCINLLKELLQAVEFSPAETLLPQAYRVNLPLIGSFIPFSGTDGRLRAVKYLGSPQRLRSSPPRSSTSAQILPSMPVIPVKAFCQSPFKVKRGYPLCCLWSAAGSLWPYGVPFFLLSPSFFLYLSNPVIVVRWAPPLSCKGFWSYNGFWLSRSTHHVLFNLLLCYQLWCHLFTWLCNLLSVHFPSSQKSALSLQFHTTASMGTARSLWCNTHISGTHIL